MADADAAAAAAAGDSAGGTGHLDAAGVVRVLHRGVLSTQMQGGLQDSTGISSEGPRVLLRTCWG